MDSIFTGLGLPGGGIGFGGPQFGPGIGGFANGNSCCGCNGGFNAGGAVNQHTQQLFMMELLLGLLMGIMGGEGMAGMGGFGGFGAPGGFGGGGFGGPGGFGGGGGGYNGIGGGGGGGGNYGGGGVNQGAANGGAPIPTGPVAPGVEGMLNRARGMLGMHEGRDTAAIQSITGKSGINPATTPWCAAFAMNLLKEHGVLDTSGLSNPNYCPTIESWARGKGIYGTPGQYTPKSGDAILFDWERDGTSDHIGIVEKVENGKVYTIEGNSSDSVKRNVYDLGSSKIDGYVITGRR